MIGWLRFQMNDASVWGYFLQALPISLIAGIVYAVVRFIKGKRKDRPIRLLNETIKFLFVCYLTGLISLVVLPVNFWLNIYDGIFLGWWNEIPSIFSFGGFNLVPTIIKALSGEIVVGSWVLFCIGCSLRARISRNLHRFSIDLAQYFFFFILANNIRNRFRQK